MTKWIEGIENPVVWAVMAEVDGTLVMCRAGSYAMVYLSQATARTQKRRLESRAGGLHLKIVRYTADSEIFMSGINDD